MVKYRCTSYDDDGRGSCSRSNCEYLHPSDGAWNTATRRPPQNDRGRQSGRHASSAMGPPPSGPRGFNKTKRCFGFNNDGTPRRHRLCNENPCKFLHPDDPGWEAAGDHSNQGYGDRGGSRPERTGSNTEPTTNTRWGKDRDTESGTATGTSGWGSGGGDSWESYSNRGAKRKASDTNDGLNGSNTASSWEHASAWDTTGPSANWGQAKKTKSGWEEPSAGWGEVSAEHNAWSQWDNGADSGSGNTKEVGMDWEQSNAGSSQWDTQTTETSASKSGKAKEASSGWNEGTTGDSPWDQHTVRQGDKAGNASNGDGVVRQSTRDVIDPKAASDATAAGPSKRPAEDVDRDSSSRRNDLWQKATTVTTRSTTDTGFGAASRSRSERGGHGDVADPLVVASPLSMTVAQHTPTVTEPAQSGSTAALPKTNLGGDADRRDSMMIDLEDNARPADKTDKKEEKLTRALSLIVEAIRLEDERQRKKQDVNNWNLERAAFHKTRIGKKATSILDKTNSDVKERLWRVEHRQKSVMEKLSTLPLLANLLPRFRRPDDIADLEDRLGSWVTWRDDLDRRIAEIQRSPPEEVAPEPQPKPSAPDSREARFEQLLARADDVMSAYDDNPPAKLILTQLEKKLEDGLEKFLENLKDASMEDGEITAVDERLGKFQGVLDAQSTEIADLAKSVAERISANEEQKKECFALREQNADLKARVTQLEADRVQIDARAENAHRAVIELREQIAKLSEAPPPPSPVPTAPVEIPPPTHQQLLHSITAPLEANVIEVLQPRLTAFDTNIRRAIMAMNAEIQGDVVKRLENAEMLVKHQMDILAQQVEATQAQSRGAS